MKVAVIGGGASGLVAAISSARKNNQVYVFEKNNTTGKKLLLTGNGRCNFGNTNQDLEKYHSSNKDLINNIINEENLKKLNDFYDSIGIIKKVKDGYIYPISEKSSSIKSALMSEAKSLNIIFMYNKDIKNIEKKDEKFLIDDKWFDKVIIATGSKSYPKTGSTGVGYEIAKSFNHKIVDVNPSLMQLKSSMGIENNLAGKRTYVKVSLYENEKFLKSEIGEIQFTKNGLSGICVFNLSRDVAIGLKENKKFSVCIDFLPWLDENIKSFFEKRANNLKFRNITELSDAFIDYSIIYTLLKYINIDPNKTWLDLNEKEKDLFCNILRNLEFKIDDTMTFLEAQTCSGGIDLTEINLNTMESKLVNGLYFVGEIIDIDGDCGGYNLTLSFLTGLLAGEK